jgi:hypothetical protein
MMFRDFYKESNSFSDRRWWISFVLALLVVICYAYYISSSMPSAESSALKTEVPIESIPLSGSELVQKADALCLSISKPEKFQFFSKTVSASEKNSATVIYRYRTERGFGEIMPAFAVWFNANGWKPVPNNQLTYRNGSRTVAIRSFDNFFMNYEIYCSETDSRATFGVDDL